MGSSPTATWRKSSTNVQSPALKSSAICLTPVFGGELDDDRGVHVARFETPLAARGCRVRCWKCGSESFTGGVWPSSASPRMGNTPSGLVGDNRDSARVCPPQITRLRPEIGVVSLLSCWLISIDLLRSSSMLRRLPSTSSTAGEFWSEMLCRSGSPLTIALRFLTESNAPHCFLSRVSSASAFLRSSRSSSTRLSWEAMAWMKSLASVGDLSKGVSLGVGGKDGIVVEMGVGLDGACVGRAIGSVRESLFELREVVDKDRVERAPNDDGGDSKASSAEGGGIISDLESFDA